MDSEIQQRHVPGFWQHAEYLVLIHLAELGVQDGDANIICDFLIGRLSQIDAILPAKANSEFYTEYAALICDAVTAGQLLFAVRSGRVPGRLLEANLGNMPRHFHPLLAAMQDVVGTIKENIAEARRWLN